MFHLDEAQECQIFGRSIFELRELRAIVISLSDSATTDIIYRAHIFYRGRFLGWLIKNYPGGLENCCDLSRRAILGSGTFLIFGWRFLRDLRNIGS